MRLCWKLLLSLGLFWSSILGVVQDFTPFFGKLTQAEYQDRLEKWGRSRFSSVSPYC